MTERYTEEELKNTIYEIGQLWRELERLNEKISNISDDIRRKFYIRERHLLQKEIKYQMKLIND